MSRAELECIIPILNVENLSRSLHYYTRLLGFTRDWGDAGMAGLSRDGRAIYLCQGAQGQPGTWIWIGVTDVLALYHEFRTVGAVIRHEPRNYPWALEMRVEDLDGHVLRFGSEPLTDEPFATYEP
jgi:catechol 2,3-dioxygenase-like lactoylglutathione lyase family enzyme